MIKALIDQEYHRELRLVLGGARKSIWISMFEIESGRGARDRDSRALVELVCARAREGIEVRVLLSQIFPNRWSDRKNQVSAWRLFNEGCDVRYLPGNRTVHAKVVIIDRARILVGSHNWTRFSLGYNLEISVITDDEELVNTVLTELNELWTRAKDFRGHVRTPAFAR